MLSFSALVVLLISCVTTLAPALAAAEAVCSGDEEPRAEQGSALLQLKGISSSSHNAELATQTDTATDDKLTQYTKLKQELAKSQESASIMKNIDQALDVDINEASNTERKASKGPARTADQAESLDEVLEAQAAVPAAAAADSAVSLLEEAAATKPASAKASAKVSLPPIDAESEEVLEAQGSQGTKPWTVAAAAKGASSKHRRSSGVADVSLVEATSASKKPKRELVEEEEATSEDNEEATEATFDESDEDIETTSETASDSEDDSDAASDDEAGTDNEAEEEEEEEGEETEETLKKRAKKLSLMAVMDMIEADSEPLNAEGYFTLASSRNNRKMERFVERVAEDMGYEIADVGGLKGMVPYYSGQKATQSFSALQKELKSTSRTSDGWLVRNRRQVSMRQKTLKAQKSPNLLLQTDATQHEAKAAHHKEHKAQNPLTLLGFSSSVKLSEAVKLVHKVPDLALALFGSRTIIMISAVAMVAILFMLDERKRTGKGDYEDPLNISPVPPPVKEDPSVAASLKALRGSKL